jgi:hypothetical protein
LFTGKVILDSPPVPKKVYPFISEEVEIIFTSIESIVTTGFHPTSFNINLTAPDKPLAIKLPQVSCE